MGGWSAVGQRFSNISFSLVQLIYFPYIHTHVHTHPRTYIRTHAGTYARTYVRNTQTHFLTPTNQRLNDSVGLKGRCDVVGVECFLAVAMVSAMCGVVQQRPADRAVIDCPDVGGDGSVQGRRFDSHGRLL